MKKGFTLVEILVVLVIIGILVALILPNTLRAIDQGNIKSAAATLRNIDTAIKLCYSEQQNWAVCGAGGLKDLEPAGTISQGYMDLLPNNAADPWGGTYTLTQDETTGGWESTKNVIFPAWPDLTPVNRS